MTAIPGSRAGFAVKGCQGVTEALLLGHGAGSHAGPVLKGLPLVLAGAVAGFRIEIVASLLGVTGGQLLIPILVILHGMDVKAANSLSMFISLPTMMTGLVRYGLAIRVRARDSRYVDINTS